MLGVAAAWAGCFVALRWGLRDAPVRWFAAARALLAGAALLALTAVQHRPMPRTGRSWTLVVVLAVVNVGVGFAAMFAGVAGGATGTAALLANAQPLLILLPAWWLYGERPTRHLTGALLLGLAGLALVAAPRGGGTGVALSLVAAGAATGGTLLLRRLDGIDLVAASGWQFAIGGVLLAGWAGWAEGRPVITWTPRFVAVLAFLSLVGTAAAFLIWFTEARRARLDQHRPWRGSGMNRLSSRVAATLAVVGLVFSASAEPVWGADDLSHKRSQLESQIASSQKQRDDLESALEDLSGQLAQTQAELQVVEDKIPAAQAGVDAATAALAGAQRQQRLIADQLADAQQRQAAIAQEAADGAAQEQQLRQAVGAMARGAYRDGGNVTGLSVLLGSTSAPDMVDGYAAVATAQRLQAQVYERVRRLQADARNRGARLSAVQQAIAGLKRQADEKVAEADAARNTAAAARAQLDDLRRQQESKQATVRGQMAEAQRQVDEADASTAAMQAQLRQVIDAQRLQAAAAKTTTTPGSAARGALFANPTANNPMYVTSEFGMRLQPILKIYRLHAGIDLRDYCGQPVYAGRDGTVVWSRYLSGYGNQVMVDHGTVDGKSLVSSYSHLTRYVVAAGQQVKAGQVVGYAGQTGGVSTGCHLHFEVYVNGTVLNPRPYLGLPPA